MSSEGDNSGFRGLFLADLLGLRGLYILHHFFFVYTTKYNINSIFSNIDEVTVYITRTKKSVVKSFLDKSKHPVFLFDEKQQQHLLRLKPRIYSTHVGSKWGTFPPSPPLSWPPFHSVLCKDMMFDMSNLKLSATTF